jgi:hypothetical protein
LKVSFCEGDPVDHAIVKLNVVPLVMPAPLPDVVRKRLRYELDIISNAGLSDYFLIVADMIDWRKLKASVWGRGVDRRRVRAFLFAWASSPSTRWPTVYFSSAS